MGIKRSANPTHHFHKSLFPWSSWLFLELVYASFLSPMNETGMVVGHSPVPEAVVCEKTDSFKELLAGR